MPKITQKIATSRSPSVLPRALSRAPLNTLSTTPGRRAMEINPRFNIGVFSPFSIIAGFKLREQTMDAAHSFVSHSPLRQAISNILAKEEGVQEVFWRESVGAIELGISTCGSIPLAEFGCGLGATVDLGFETSALLCYRYIRPARLYKGSEKDEALHDHVAPFPLTVKDAQSMPLGREVELCGRGRLYMGSGFSLNEGVGIGGVVKIGAGFSVAALQGIAGEYALSVQSLDGKNLVRVTVRKTNENIKEAGIALRAGILQVLSIPIPPFGSGGLPALTHSATKGVCSALMSNFGAVVARAGSGLAKKQETICCFDLDLSQESAQIAYQHLLKLNVSMADAMHKESLGGISKVSLKEREEMDFRTHCFKAFDQQAYGKEKNNIKRDGMLTKNDGAIVLYRDKIHHEHSDNWFTGLRDLKWEGITVKDSKGCLHTYYRLVYERQNKIPQQSYVDRYFSLAKHLGIKSVIEEKSKLIEMHDVVKLFSGSDDITASMELFFTEEGVHRILQAKALQGQLAFQRANSDTRTDEQWEKTNLMLARYKKLARERWKIFGKSEAMETLSTEYHTQFKQDLETDLALLEKARAFGAFIGAFKKANDHKSAQAFFTMLGSSAFDYTEIIKALTFLSGRSNLKVHTLSLSGGDIAIKSTDEGEILHPRTSINRLPGVASDANDIAFE